MKNKEAAQNIFLFRQKEDILAFPQKAENNLTLVPPPFFIPQPKIFNSNISDKNGCERNGGIYNMPSGIDFDIVGHAFFRGMCPPLVNWPLNSPSKFQSGLSNGRENGNFVCLSHRPR